jgi:hypothetical protein
MGGRRGGGPLRPAELSRPTSREWVFQDVSQLLPKQADQGIFRRSVEVSVDFRADSDAHSGADDVAADGHANGVAHEVAHFEIPIASSDEDADLSDADYSIAHLSGRHQSGKPGIQIDLGYRRGC